MPNGMANARVTCKGKELPGDKVEQIEREFETHHEFYQHALNTLIEEGLDEILGAEGDDIEVHMHEEARDFTVHPYVPMCQASIKETLNGLRRYTPVQAEYIYEIAITTKFLKS